MEGTIGALEERVTRTVERLRELSAERDRLMEDLSALKDRLERSHGTADDDSFATGGRRADSDEVADEIRRALEELKGP